MNFFHFEHFLGFQNRMVSKSIHFLCALFSAIGFFPPDDNQIWNTKILWQPIPIHTIPERLDYVLAAKKPCQRYNYALNEYFNSPEYNALYEKFKPLFKYLEENSGAPVKSFEQVQYLYNTLFIENLRNLSYVFDGTYQNFFCA